MSPSDTVPVSGPGRPVGPTGDLTGPGFGGGSVPDTASDRVFWEEDPPVTAPDRVLGGGYLTSDRTGPGLKTGFYLFFFNEEKTFPSRNETPERVEERCCILRVKKIRN